MLFQNIGDRVVRQQMTEIGQCSLNPTVAPARVLLSHPNHQVRDFFRRSTSSWFSKWAAIVLLSDEFPVPRHQGFWSHNRRHLRQQLAAEFFRLRRQSAALFVGESHSFATDLLTKNAILLEQIFDDMLLMPIHPARDRHDNK